MTDTGRVPLIEAGGRELAGLGHELQKQMSDR